MHMSAFGGRGFGAAHGAGPGGMRSLRGPDKKPPPLMDPTRERDRGRILRLFRPYRVRLTIVLSTIVFYARLGVHRPFLIRAVLDQRIFEHKTTLLTLLVLAMIAIAVVTAVFNVWQTYLSNVVGQRGMPD